VLTTSAASVGAGRKQPMIFSNICSAYVSCQCVAVTRRIAYPHFKTVARKFSTGGLCSSAGGIDFTKLTKTPLIYSVSRFNLGGGLGALFGGAKHTKASPWLRDCPISWYFQE